MRHVLLRREARRIKYPTPKYEDSTEQYIKQLQTTILILMGTNVQAPLKQRNRRHLYRGMKRRFIFTKRRFSKKKKERSVLR
jgi:hypothetical protein